MRSWICLCLALGGQEPGSADWPMWRHDAAHTASTSRALPDRLQLQWIRELPPLKPGFSDQPRLQLDAAYEPVVLGQTLLVPSSRTDSLSAYDTRSGQEKWTFVTDGPVRYPAAAWEGRVYVASDDGHLYCLDAERGSLQWRCFGGPRDRRILGNERLISTWPARGAPVVADGTVYFASGIWPFMGTFLYALDARSGKVQWCNEGDGSTWMKQPHNTEAFGGVAPQGPLALVGDRLLVAGGRSVPACYDRHTGKLQYFQFAENGRRGGVDVSAAGTYFCAGGGAYDLGTGTYAGETGRAVVATPGAIWYAGKTKDLLVAKPPITTTIETIDRKGQKTTKPMWKMSPAQTIEAPRTECLIRAGERFYLGTEGRVAVYEKNREVGQIRLEGTPASLLAADDRLFVVTREGRIACYGPESRAPQSYAWSPRTDLGKGPSAMAETMIAQGVADGYGVVFSQAGAGTLLAEAGRTRSHLIFIHPDLQTVEEMRSRLSAAGVYGEEAEVHPGTVDTVELPPYLAQAIFFDGPELSAARLRKLFGALRPFGGKLFLPKSLHPRPQIDRGISEAGLLGSLLTETDREWVVERSGPLPGSGNWTHEHADAANTRVSKDRIVRAPLGLLWFGGPSNEGILPRHGHGPQPQVIDGRLILEGVDKMRATDIYTGRLLWEVSLPGVGDFYNNVVHQAGANATGTNFISTSDGIYVAWREKCLRLDPATGKTLSEFTLPGASPAWGYLNVVGDVLLGGADPLLDVKVERKVEGGFDDPLANPGSLITRILSFKGDNDTLSASRRLVAMDRRTGKVLWVAQARAAFRHNAICAGGGRIYAIDRLSGPQIDRLKKKNEVPKILPRMVAWDLRDGKELWQSEADVFGTWLSYSEDRDILVEAGRVARDTLSDEAKGMRARQGADGTELWKKAYLGPAMIHGDTILMSDRACDLRTGQATARLHPITQQAVEWSWARTYGCNTPSASEHLLTFRSGAAGYFDLACDGGTGNFGGFRSSCTNNLIVAGGVISAPDYTRTCTCSYQNQASVALVPMPEAEEWTFFGDDKISGPVRRLGVNLGAAGDRRAEDGTLWIEHPSVGGKSPSAPVSMNPDKPSMFRKNSLRVSGEGIPWVASSGARGIREFTLSLDRDAKTERLYTVRLHFLEPDGLKPGERVFDVSLQGQGVLKDFDVSREAGGPDRSLVREFREVRAKKDLKISFLPRVSVPVLSGVEVALSCRIPVFRFALERWEADPYPAVVRGEGPPLPPGANLRVDRLGGGDRIEVAFPGGEGPLLWAGSPDPGTIQRILDSPARREILHRLLGGQSAVWVLLEGDPKDETSAGLLDATLRELEESLELPELREVPEDTLSNQTVPFKLAFSSLSLKRGDPEESFLVKMLLESAPGLGARTGPLVVPVFGRGRALAGFDLSREAVRKAAEALIRPCTREAKSSVPGMDLLMTADWTGLVGEPPGKVTEIPPGQTLQHPRPEEEVVGPFEPEALSFRTQVGWVLGTAGAILVLFLKLRSRRSA